MRFGPTSLAMTDLRRRFSDPWAWSGPVVCTLLVVLNIAQPTQETSFDTKLDLTVNPLQWLSNAARMWNPDHQLGMIQNQAYGYLFPIGPFFALGNLLGMPAWFWQRLWSGLVLALAFEGCRRLVRWAVPGAGAALAVAAGLAFATAPRLLGTVGVLSGESLPGAVLPWTVLPLVMAAHGRLTWQRGILLSAATVPLMGGHNATEVILILPLPALLLLLQPVPLRKRAVTLGHWGGLVALGTAWWWIPLLLMGKYSPPFLDYIESGRNVTAGVGWFEVLRGATHWVGNASPDLTHWVAANRLAMTAGPVLGFTLVAVIGLVGLTLKGIQDRRAFVVGLLAGVVLLAAGHVGGAESGWKEAWWGALDGPAAPFRNIHKLDPIVRLSIALGLANAFARARLWIDRVALPWPTRRIRGAWVGVAAILLCVGTVAPAALELRDPAGWDRLPPEWDSASRLIARDGGRALVVPGNGAAVQTWGRTVDEVLQTQSGIEFATFGGAPLMPVGTARMLEGLDRMLTSGRMSPGLAKALAGAGFTHVVVRNDVSATASREAAARARASLRQSPDISLESALGVGVGGDPMIEVFRVVEPVPTVSVTPVAATRYAPEADPEALVRDVGNGEDPGVLTSSPLANQQGRFVSDGIARRERAFGNVRDSVSHIRLIDEAYDLHRKVPDFVPENVTQTSPAIIDGIAAIRTASGVSRADNYGPVDAASGPWAALDRDLMTAWRSGSLQPPVGQWFEIDFSRPRAVPRLAVQFATFGVAVPTRVGITTDGGTVTRDVPPDGRLTVLGMPSGQTRSVRLEVLGAGLSQGPIAIAELTLGDGDLQRFVHVPTAASSADIMAFSTEEGDPACADDGHGLRCTARRVSDEANALAREFTVSRAGTWQATARVTSAPDADPARLFTPLEPSTSVAASSTFGNEAAVNATFAFDGDRSTSWFASPFDATPTLTLTWPTEQTVSEISLDGGPRPLGPLPTRAVLQAGTETREVSFSSGHAGFAPITTREITLAFSGTPPNQGVSIAEIDLPGASLGSVSLPWATRTGAICGLGPPLDIDGRIIKTQVSGTLADVVRGAPLTVTTCGEDVFLASGTHRVRMMATFGFHPVSLRLVPVDARKADGGPVGSRIVTDTAELRVVEVQPGPESVLSLPVNTNSGWRATAGAQSLTPVVVDGWKQGFVLPSGTSPRTVVLDYAPGAGFRLSLLVGALGALTMLGLVLREGWRVRHEAAGGRVLIETDRHEGHLHPAIVGAIGLLIAIAGGMLVTVVATVSLLLRRPTLACWLAVLAFTVAAICWLVGFPVAADVASAVGFGMLVPWLLRSRAR